MTYQRDPLSARYDDQAAQTIAAAIRAYERKRKNQRIRGYVEARIVSPPEVREQGGARLSRTERAFQRALYYDDRIHQLTGGRKKPRARYSLKVDWQPVPLLPGQWRTAHVQVFGRASGRRHVETGPDRDSFVNNPALRSTAAAGRQG